MSSDGNESLSTANTDNYLVPVTIDKEPIIFNGNDATIEGTLYECGRFYKRNGLFQPLFSHRAVALSNGKLAVESPNTVYFTTGKIVDAHDFDDPCPPRMATTPLWAHG